MTLSLISPSIEPEQLQQLRFLGALLASLHDYDGQDLDIADYVHYQSQALLMRYAIKVRSPELFVYRTCTDQENQMAVLYAPQLLAALVQSRALQRLHAGNLEFVCQAAEGLSHLLLAARCASFDAKVTALQLEYQAEIDKFALCWHLFVQQGVAPAHFAKPLFKLLFGRLYLREGMSGLWRRRYVRAHMQAVRAVESQIACWLRQHPSVSCVRIARFVQAHTRRLLCWV